MEKVIQDFSLFGIDELDKAYKQFQFRYVDNNKLKQNNIPMRRKPYKKMIMRKKFTEEDGLFHSTHGGVLRTGKSVMENMLLKMRNDGYDELRSQYNKIMFKELKKQLENAPASNNNAPGESCYGRYSYGLGTERTADHMYANSKLLALRRTADFSYMVLDDPEEKYKKIFDCIKNKE